MMINFYKATKRKPEPGVTEWRYTDGAGNRITAKLQHRTEMVQIECWRSNISVQAFIVPPSMLQETLRHLDENGLDADISKLVAKAYLSSKARAIKSLNTESGHLN
jgi:hypothetical protein